MIIKITEDDFESAVDITSEMLKTGGVIVYPTDTVYGLGCDATSDAAVAKIHEIKGIKERRPMSVMVSDFSMLDYYCETGLWEDIILKKYLPGPYTFVLKKLHELPVSPTEKIGVRIPDSPFCQALCEKFARPIVTTSANITKQNAPTVFEDVEKSIIDNVDLSIDGGFTKYKSPSVVIDLVERKLLREGSRDSINIIELPEP